jgi:glyoxylase-like metal-dependent hydrolase (beta-lactamase superfamily II)
MKRVLVFWLVAFSVFCTLNAAIAGEGLVKLSDGIYSYVGAVEDSPARSFGANAGVVIGGEGILVVDTLVSAGEARKFIADIRKVTGKPVRYVVNTHCHLDHAFGNSEFRKLGAVIIAHTDCKAYLERHGDETLKNIGQYGLTPEQMQGTEVAYPDMVFSDRLGMDLGGVKVELIYAGPSHVDGSVLVYLPDEKVLFAGDVLFTDFHPFLGEGDLAGWQKALDYIEDLEVEKIVPGHGPLSTKKDVRDMEEYLRVFDGLARELSSASSDPEYVAAEMAKALPHRRLGLGLIKFNIMTRYLEQKD